jgi:hypothetical protein
MPTRKHASGFRALIYCQWAYNFTPYVFQAARKFLLEHRTISDNMLLHRLSVLLFIAGVNSAPANVCASNPYVLLLPLSAYPPVESFCSSRYPVAPLTSVTTTISLSTVTSTTSSITTDLATSTDVETSFIATTSFTTVTVTV